MHNQPLMVDSWMREAQEASRLIEDLESKAKNKDPNIQKEEEEKQFRVLEISRSKVLEVGIKLDRLESLLHNPPSKPILNDEDLEFRWKMLSDIQLRTRRLAISLYALPSPNRPGSLPAASPPEKTKTLYGHEQDKTEASSKNDPPELLRPLISDSEKGQVQIKGCTTSTLVSLLRKTIWTVGLLLGSAALLFILVIICAII